MPSWSKDAKEFTVSITHNRQRGTSYIYISKPILAKLGNPSGLKFIIRGEDIVVCRPDE